MGMIKVDNVVKKYEDIVAIDDVSFEVAEGEIFGVIGPDGAGKTTLFRMLVTLLLADEGELSIAGYDVRKDYKKIREMIGYMPGRFSLYSDLTVRENLEFYATVFGTTIEENYDLVKPIYAQIEPYEKRLAGRLSGGMKQKLALSCALIHRPKVLILDEPTTGVDAVSRQEFWEMLKETAALGISILVSTPYMDEASLCDRVALLHSGKILSMGSPDEISGAAKLCMYRFRSAGRMFDYLPRFRAIDEGIRAWAFGDEVHVFIPEGFDVAALESEVLSWGVSELEWEKADAGVEDVFLSVGS